MKLRSGESRDAWLGLPLEVETLVPDLLAAGGADPGEYETAITALIARGNGDRWLAHLRSLTADLDRRVSALGVDAAVTEADVTLARILRDQFLLAQGICRTQAADDAALQRLESLLRRAAGATAEH